MASEEELKKQKEEAEKLANEFSLIDEGITSLGNKIKDVIKKAATDLSGVVAATQGLDESTQSLAKKFSNDISRATAKIVNDNAELNRLQAKQAKQEDLTATELKRIQILKDRQDRNKLAIDQAIISLLRIGVNLDEELLVLLDEQLEKREDIIDKIQEENEERLKSQGITKSLFQTVKNVAFKFDQTGLAAKLLNKSLNVTQGFLLAGNAAIAALVKGTLNASNNISNIAKNTGLSADEAKRLQINFAVASLDSNKLFITSQRLNEAFVELTRQSGLIADFGGDILITQATLTKQLGLSAEQAGNLSLLSRIQSEDTEGILENTISTVGAISSQNKVALDAKGILAEVASTSAAIAVSLSMNPVELAEAVSQAKLLGLSLSEVDAIASSLLDFESSITAELEAEVLLGRDLNLERARLLALNNDLVGLGEEIRNQEEIRLAFATGNRLQQEAAAKAIGISRDQLAKITLQQEINRLGAEQFKDTYGEVTFQQLQSQSASEKFADTLTKIQGIIGDIGIVLAPILDTFASILGYIAESKVLAGGLTAILGGLAAKSLITAIGSIFTAGFTLGPIGGAIAAAAGAGLLLSQVSKAKSTVADDLISPGYGERVILSPEGTIALNNEDTIVAGTNLMGENNLANNVTPITNNTTNTITPINNPVNNTITPITNNTTNTITPINNPVNNTTTPISNTVISSNSSLRNQTSSTVVTTPNDNSSLIRELRENNKYLKQIAEREGTVKIDSTRAGTAFSMGTYQVQ